ncbi:TonB-dependent receptor [Urechidicola vernalis]|uniref:TonB-dependent receptor plug domain-containing protein n=1 Tax=Urechidicola vernalis TaxID=3075600 RepID=A0ABU2Y371_9FLAO|nr:TonB-dependent receptor plug domain-containing protein [Urechidicola sp. P050]MDT0552651.1 TonB-dependent receptor plug domain-containing protein [Urechidicola sp. P050]
MNRTKNLILVFTFLFCHIFYAQVGEDKESLAKILETIEQQFECNFSYADNTIAEIFIENPKTFKSLKNALKYLRQHTKLEFTVLDVSNITVSTNYKSNTLCGYLIDIETEEPIIGAVIRVDAEITTTNEEGYFNLERPTENKLLVISHLSYKGVRYQLNSINESSCDPIYLVPKIEQISEIVVRNYLTKGIQKTSKGSYDIDYKKFDILPGLIEPDVLQTLQALPGIQSADESVSNINIRGGANHENLVLWDGMKMYQSGHFFGLISAFNSHLTRNATLIQNGTDADLSEGVSGTILMNTDSELNTKTKTEIGLNLINADVFFDTPIGDQSSLQLSARKSINNLIETPTYKQYFDKAFQNTELLQDSDNVIKSDGEFSFYDVNARWLYEITPYDKIRVNFLLFDNNLFFLENAVVDGEEASKESSASQRNLAGGVSYLREWNEWFSTDLQFYASKYNLESINHDLVNNQRLLQENEVFEEAVKLDTEYKLSDMISLYNGYQYQETGVTNIQDVDDPLYRKEVKQVIRSHGLSSQLGYTSNDFNTTARIGVRFNYLEKFDSFVIEPRISFSHRFLDNFTLQLLGEVKHQTASQIIDFQEDFLGVENRRWILSNNGSFNAEEGEYDIPIMESVQGSAGLFYANKGWLISAEGYYKIVDGITSKSQGFQNQYQYINTTGSYEVFGADFLIRKRLNKFNTWLSYSYGDNQYTFSELEENVFPSNVDIRHAVNLATSYSLKNLDISAGLNWHSGKPTTKPIEGNEIIDDKINYETANMGRLEDYMRVDVSAQYQFKLSKKMKARAGVSVWNLFNQENLTNTYYKIVEDSVTEVQQKSLGLTPNISFRVGF